MIPMCVCGHGNWVHVGYVGGCGLCACAAYRPPDVYATTTTNNTRPTTTEDQP